VVDGNCFGGGKTVHTQMGGRVILAVRLESACEGPNTIRGRDEGKEDTNDKCIGGTTNLMAQAR
jgi:hypothetical protein